MTESISPLWFTWSGSVNLNILNHYNGLTIESTSIQFTETQDTAETLAMTQAISSGTLDSDLYYSPSGIILKNAGSLAGKYKISLRGFDSDNEMINYLSLPFTFDFDKEYHLAAGETLLIPWSVKCKVVNAPDDGKNIYGATLNLDLAPKNRYNYKEDSDRHTISIQAKNANNEYGDRTSDIEFTGEIII